MSWSPAFSVAVGYVIGRAVVGCAHWLAGFADELIR